MFYKFSFVFLFFVGFFSFSLKITEVYYDGTDEFIEIFNDDNKLFLDEVIISGAKSSNIKVKLNLSGYENIVLADSLDFFSGVNKSLTGYAFSLYDTKSINISLIYSGKILDKFFVSENLVNSFNNKKTSFEKIFSGGSWILRPVLEGKNVICRNLSGYLHSNNR